MKIEKDILLGGFTTFKIGGPADHFCRATNEADLLGAISFARKNNLSVFILGGGSNLLVSDLGFRGLVIKMEMKGMAWKETEHGAELTAEAGESWDDAVKESVEKGYFGLENLSDIPGTVGASAVQNIGAYGAEAKDRISRVEALNMETGEKSFFSNEACRFGYRDSFFKSQEGKKHVILRVTFSLKKDSSLNFGYKDIETFFSGRDLNSVSINEFREAIISIRKSKLPDLSCLGTAGSFFKNPVMSDVAFAALKEKYPGIPSFPAAPGQMKVPLAWILDKVLHLKGFSSGAAAVYENQPLVLVNRGGASAEEVAGLANMIAAKVKDTTGLVIESEVETV